MAVLGSLGNFYVVLLFLILIGGSGVMAYNFSRNFWEKSEKFMEKKGGRFMNKWIKLAVTSFVGILIASFALGITNNLSGQDPNSTHNSHGAGSQTVSGQMTNNQMGYSQMGNGQMGNTQVNGSYEAQLYQMQMNMVQMQQQLAQLMQAYTNQNLNYGGMNGVPGYNYGGQMYGPPIGNPGMNNMSPMNGMNNMNNTNSTNGMGSTNNSSGSGSMGGMSMM